LEIVLETHVSYHAAREVKKEDLETGFFFANLYTEFSVQTNNGATQNRSQAYGKKLQFS
jgi:hypothetical protein